jgi:hypothetical protein
LDKHQDHSGRTVLYALPFNRVFVAPYWKGPDAAQTEPLCQDLQGTAVIAGSIPHATPVLKRKERPMGEFLRELWAFMKDRKKFWLLPIVLCLLLLGGLVAFTSSSAVAPFIYSLF